jgi:hypothetical protein
MASQIICEKLSLKILFNIPVKKFKGCGMEKLFVFYKIFS